VAMVVWIERNVMSAPRSKKLLYFSIGLQRKS